MKNYTQDNFGSQPPDMENIDAANISWSKELDWIVVGSGGGGLTSAITAHKHGLQTLVVEKTPFVGGTTARSGGGVWIPGNSMFNLDKTIDTKEDIKAYLDATIGDDSPEPLKASFMRNGPKMLDFIERNSHLKFRLTPRYADYYPERPGGRIAGRSMEPVSFDAKCLGDNLKNLREPVLPVARGAGLGLTEARDLYYLMRETREKGRLAALARFVYTASTDFLLGRVTTSLGQAIIAPLYYSMLKQEIPIEINTAFTGLVVENKRVVGIAVSNHKGRFYYKARKGVLLATGGFAKNQKMREEYLPQPTGAQWSLSAEGDTGDAIIAGKQLDAKLGLMDDAWWTPVSHMTGNADPYFNICERSAPGTIVVSPLGRRFVNEAAPYCDFVKGMYKSQDNPADYQPCWLIMDARHRRRYTLGSTPPFVPLPAKYFKSGEFVKAGSIRKLAQKTNVPFDELNKTLERFNKDCLGQRDTEFKRGDSAYDNYFGDGSMPNPNLETINKAPFYAVKLFPGDIGTRGGLVTNQQAQVVSNSDEIIEGLYATGNAMASVMGHSYPGPGATIGPSMTFGYVAAMHAAGEG
jgi:3-oxosteroid 1-dehydrogenase